MSQVPIQLYPNPVIRQPDSSHSNGSFGPVFIVLAVIVVISAVACVVGRWCNRRQHHAKESHHHHNHQPKANVQSHSLGPKEWESRAKPSFKMRERGEIEFGFDKRKPSAKVAGNGGGMVRPPHYNGGHKPEVRFASNV